MHCVSKCSESLINILNVLNILNIIKILSLLNLLKVPSILDVLNILTSNRDYNKSIKLEKSPKLSKRPNGREPCEEQKMLLDPKLSNLFNFNQNLSRKPLVLDFTKNAQLPPLVLIIKSSRISQKVRSSKVGRPVKVTKVTKTRNIRKLTKVSKVTSLSKSTKTMNLRKLTKLTEQTKLTTNKC